MSFLEKFENLKKTEPWEATNGVWRENSPASHRGGQISNSFWVMDFGLVENSAYLYFPYQLNQCFDCSFTFDSELCYECLDCMKCYNCGHSQECNRCVDCHLCWYCKDCQDCFGCFGLDGKRFCIYNKQYSKEEYVEKVEKYKKRTYEENRNELDEISTKHPFPFSNQVNSDNTPYGDHIVQSRDSYWVFDSIGLEECGYMIQSKFDVNCFDCAQLFKSELCYECDSGGMNYGCSFMDQGSYCRYCHYCVNCSNSEHCFGCVNLEHAEYCILNEKYNSKDYFKKVKEIREELGWPEIKGWSDTEGGSVF